MSSFTAKEGESVEALPTVRQIELALKNRLGCVDGVDTDSKSYSSLVELDRYINKKKRKTNATATADKTEGGWYEKAAQYWDDEANCPITDDGVLGGYGKLTPMDSRDSNLFLDRLHTQFPSLQFDTVADCGAGIGRVTKFLLANRFREVHLIEQSARLLQSAREYIGLPTEEDEKRIVYVEQGLQDFSPAPNTFDVIWIQWVIGHLHDHDFIRFFRRCVQGLRPHGVIVLKDNTIVDPELAFCLDLQDNSVARNIEYQKLLFDCAGLEVVAEQIQRDFPEELYPVYMFALRAKAV